MDYLQLLQSTCLNRDRTMGLKLCSNAYFKVLQKMQTRSLKELHPTPHSEQCPLWRSNMLEKVEKEEGMGPMLSSPL